jgi:hypothetical protein
MQIINMMKHQLKANALVNMLNFIVMEEELALNLDGVKE